MSFIRISIILDSVFELWGYKIEDFLIRILGKFVKKKKT